jgi:hypothetical protein
MLRLAPTTISLTTAEVTEVGHRRLFRRFLDADDPWDICWASAIDHAKSELAFNMTPIKPTSQQNSSQRDISPPSNRPRPLVVDPPVMLAPEQRAEEHISPMPEPSGKQERGVKAGEEQRPGLSGTVQLCIRLRRRSLPTITAADVIVDPGCATSQHISSEDATHKSSEDEAIMEQACGRSLSTSPRISLLETGSQGSSGSASSQLVSRFKIPYCWGSC